MSDTENVGPESSLQVEKSSGLSISLSSLEAKDKLEDEFNLKTEQGKGLDLDRISITTVSSLDSHLHPSSRTSSKSAIKPLACEMCNNYELQLQEVQFRENVLQSDIVQHEKNVKKMREELRKEQTFRNELEDKYNEEAKKASVDTERLRKQIDHDRKKLAEIIQKFNRFEHHTHEITEQLVRQSDSLKKELERLKLENEILLGKYIAKSDQMLSEEINIPQTLDELQIYCLTLRENLIQVMVSREQVETQLKSENLFLKEQLHSNDNERKMMDENFTQELEVLNNQLKQRRKEVEEWKKRYAKSSKELENVNAQSANSSEMLTKYDSQIQELVVFKSKAEDELSHLRNKVQSLQVELDNSEEVQRDFVKLSQSLQVQLENIRQANSDVRWQHEDDVAECNDCKKVFHSKKEKTNCRHCGRIFCADCLPRTWSSGPNNRPNKVCNVCYTLLDKQTACWFADKLPTSPN